MSVRAGREFLAIPGPTTVPDEVLRAMHRPAVDIYSGPLLELTDGLMRDMSRVFRTAGKSYIYIANGHGVWEAALTNVLSRGDRILVLESGRFAVGWGNAAALMGVQVETLPGDWRRAVRPAELEAYLKADKAKANGAPLKAILGVQVDTASGVVNDIAALSKAIKAAGHDALFMVDVVASLGCMPFEMDAWGIDVSVAASQKGLMTPPGLGFVAAGPRARAAHQNAGLRTPYWDWTARDGSEHYQKYAGTPPQHLLFGLRQALDMLFEEGLDNVYARHQRLADAVRAAVRGWGLRPVCVDPAYASNTITAVYTPEGVDSNAVLKHAREQYGLSLGGGIGKLSGQAIRIGHLGSLNELEVLGTLGGVELSFNDLGIDVEMGSGLLAAQRSFSAAKPAAARAEPALAAVH